MVQLDITVRVSGPLFDGRFSQGVERILQEAQAEVGAYALERVQFFLDKSIRRPTPYYETQITQQRLGQFEIVHDRGIVYGPWLEGTSSRNRTTRFKGYKSFRRARDQTAEAMPGIVNQVIRRNRGRLG